jgi:hypothetical protein
MSQDSLKSEILGTSHIVYAVRDVAKAGRRLAGNGYAEHGSNAASPNPPAKAPFIAGPLADTAEMNLVVSAAGAPALEMTCEPASPGAPIFFEAVLSEEPLCDPAIVRAALEEDPPEGLPGFRRPASVARATGVGALVLHACSEEATLGLWRTLGVEPEKADGMLRLRVRGIRSSQRLHVYLRADRREAGIAHLNDGGVVCLSFFCKDADSLREALMRAGYEVGDCFDITPFDAPLRVFFMRNVSGEIYEFLSVSLRRSGGGA